MSAETIVIEVIGWAAAVIILAAYILLSLGKLEGRSYPLSMDERDRRGRLHRQFGL